MFRAGNWLIVRDFPLFWLIVQIGLGENWLIVEHNLLTSRKLAYSCRSRGQGDLTAPKLAYSWRFQISNCEPAGVPIARNWRGGPTRAAAAKIWLFPLGIFPLEIPLEVPFRNPNVYFLWSLKSVVAPSPPVTSLWRVGYAQAMQGMFHAWYVARDLSMWCFWLIFNDSFARCVRTLERSFYCACRDQTVSAPVWRCWKNK